MPAITAWDVVKEDDRFVRSEVASHLMTVC
jgi:hypothetical protein